MAVYTKEQADKAIDLRKAGTPIKEIGEVVGMSKGALKYLFTLVGLTIPKETQQANALKAKLTKNPNAFEDMRSKRTPESFARQKESVTKAWENEELRAAQSLRHKGTSKPSKTKIILDQETVDAMVDFYKSGANSVEVMEKFNLSYGTCYRILKEAGNEFRPDGTQYIQNDHYFSNIDTEYKAYWLGFITADGYVDEKRHKLGIQLMLSDEDHLKKFLKCIESSPDRPIFKRRRFRWNVWSESGAIQITSQQIVNDLVKVGVVQNKTFKIKPWNGPKELMRHYYRGLVDGDGSMSKYKSTSNTWNISLCGNRYIIEGFKEFVFNSINLDGYVNTYKREERAELWYCQFHATKAKLVSALLYKDSTIYLNRKYELFKIIQK